MFGKKAETEVVEEVERELKFKEWFNLKGIRAEIKNVHWLTKKELFNNMEHQPVISFEECNTLNGTDRGGFGSTGRA